VYRSHVRHRRNDTSRLVREIKRRLHARSRPAAISSASSSSSSSISSFFSSAPFSPFTRCAFPHQRLNRAILGRAANTSHADGEDVLRNRWPLSNIFLPASLVLTILRSDSLASPRARSRDVPARARAGIHKYVPGQDAWSRSLPLTDGNHLPPRRARTKIRQSPSITEN